MVRSKVKLQVKCVVCDWMVVAVAVCFFSLPSQLFSLVYSVLEEICKSCLVEDGLGILNFHVLPTQMKAPSNSNFDDVTASYGSLIATQSATQLRQK